MPKATLPGSPGAGWTRTCDWVMSATRQVVAPSTRSRQDRVSKTMSSSSSPTRRPSLEQVDGIEAAVGDGAPRSAPPAAVRRRGHAACRWSGPDRGSEVPELVRGITAGQHVEHASSERRLRSVKGRAWVTRRCRSATVHSSIATAATICWASTSIGLRGIVVCSISAGVHAFDDRRRFRRSPGTWGRSCPGGLPDRVPGAADPLNARAPPKAATPPVPRGPRRPCRSPARGSWWPRSPADDRSSAGPRSRSAAPSQRAVVAWTSSGSPSRR